MTDKIHNVLAILFGVMLAIFGLNKFLGFMPMPEINEAAGATMGAFAATGWLFTLVGLAEIIGGVFTAIPKYRALGAIVLFPVLVGILLFHVVQEPNGLPMAVVLMAINVWIIFKNKDRYMHMIA